MQILGGPSATMDKVVPNIPSSAHARFKNEMVPALWKAAVRLGVDPVGVIAQAGHETGWGNYAGKVKPEFYNTAGIKVRHMNLFPGITDDDNPLAHSMFASWDVGATAHAQHLRAYCNKPVTEELIVDPRYWLVIGKHNAQHWSDLGGKWAPSVSYGTAIEDIIRRLSA